ncbi:hypothetical protein [Sphingomonas sp.]|uniref:hypothetical protein n=1 Tax=Sphingomonas sp. TaxID=28214 RepID=UPI003B00DE52
MMEAVGASFGQVIAPVVVAKDFVDLLENGRHDDRQSVLIQLASATSATAGDLDAAAGGIEARTSDFVMAGGGKTEDAEVDRLRRYLAAKLTRSEVDALRTAYQDLSIKMVWRDSRKRAHCLGGARHRDPCRPSPFSRAQAPGATPSSASPAPGAAIPKLARRSRC